MIARFHRLGLSVGRLRCVLFSSSLFTYVNYKHDTKSVDRLSNALENDHVLLTNRTACTSGITEYVRTLLCPRHRLSIADHSRVDRFRRGSGRNGQRRRHRDITPDDPATGDVMNRHRTSSLCRPLPGPSSATVTPAVPNVRISFNMSSDASSRDNPNVDPSPCANVKS